MVVLGLDFVYFLIFVVWEVWVILIFEMIEEN